MASPSSPAWYGSCCESCPQLMRPMAMVEPHDGFPPDQVREAARGSLCPLMVETGHTGVWARVWCSISLLLCSAPSKGTGAGLGGWASPGGLSLPPWAHALKSLAPVLVGRGATTATAPAQSPYRDPSLLLLLSPSLSSPFLSPPELPRSWNSCCLLCCPPKAGFDPLPSGTSKAATS